MRGSLYQSLSCHSYLINVVYINLQGGEINGSLQPSRYRHYKGKLYEMIDVARHSKTEEIY